MSLKLLDFDLCLLYVVLFCCVLFYFALCLLFGLMLLEAALCFICCSILLDVCLIPSMLLDVANSCLLLKFAFYWQCCIISDHFFIWLHVARCCFNVLNVFEMDGLRFILLRVVLL